MCYDDETKSLHFVSSWGYTSSNEAEHAGKISKILFSSSMYKQFIAWSNFHYHENLLRQSRLQFLIETKIVLIFLTRKNIDQKVQGLSSDKFVALE